MSKKGRNICSHLCLAIFFPSSSFSSPLASAAAAVPFGTGADATEEDEFATSDASRVGGGGAPPPSIVSSSSYKKRPSLHREIYIEVFSPWAGNPWLTANSNLYSSDSQKGVFLLLRTNRVTKNQLMLIFFRSDLTKT